MKTDFRPGKQGEKGYSIVEMIVAMVIFMIIIGTIYGLLQIGLIDRNRASRRSDVLKNARAAVHLIGRDALNAGLSYNRSGAMVPDDFISTRLGLPADADTERDVLTSIIGGNNLFFDILNDDPTVRTDLIAFAYRDSNFNAGNVISLNNAGAASGAPATVRLQTPQNEARNVQAFDLYLIESDSSQVAVMATGRPSLSQIDIAPGDPLGINQPLNGSGTGVSLLQKCTATVTENCTTYVAAVKRFFWVAYKVKSDGTLVRQIFGNNSGASAGEQIQEMPIAYNIEDFQIRYIMEDGSTTDLPADFNLVRQITVAITVQATEDDEQLGVPEKITLSSTFSARNLEYDAG
jgi:type II secretory pathway pseudopilin PulG